jgi:ABC-type sugar transport system ATPase subunit
MHECLAIRLSGEALTATVAPRRRRDTELMASAISTRSGAEQARHAVGPVLEMRDIVKNFGATYALEGASLTLHPGRIHALLGENGAGKSTLVKIVVGAVARDSGSIRLEGKDVVFRSVTDAIARGVVPIYQQLSLFPQLSVRENLSAFALGGTTRLRSRPVLIPEATAKSWLAAVGLDVDLERRVETLSVGERQLVEIARGIGQKCRVLVLDEPTAALTHEEADRLASVIRRLCAEGSAVLFISHKLDEIEALADDITVLRNGRSVIDCATAGEFTREMLVRAMLGTTIRIAARELPQPGSPVLRVRGLKVHRHSPPMDLAVGHGEIVGLAGLVASGALEIGAAIAGARLASAGNFAVGDQIYPAGGRERAIRLGVGYIPGDRHSEGVFPVLSALENASACVLPSVSRGGLLDHRAERDKLVPWLRRLKLNPLKPALAASDFSGGNQQKLVISRNLAMPNLRVLVVLEPTRGVDIGAREIIHDALIETARRGVAIVIASSDLDEIQSLSHRILIVRQGAVTNEMPGTAERSRLMDALAGRDAR